MSHLTEAQIEALTALHERYHAEFVPEAFQPIFDLPNGWVAGWVVSGDRSHAIYVGCSPEGEISS